MPKLTKQVVQTWLETVEAGKAFHYKAVLDGLVDAEAWPSLRNIISDLRAANILAAAPNKDAGWYYKVEQIDEISNVMGGGQDYLDITYPASHEEEDPSGFPFADMLAVSPGDLLVFAGGSNSGKTALILNMLADNLNKDKDMLLMGNEYVTADKTVTPRFRRRFQAIDWSPILDDEGNLLFRLKPVKGHFENYIRKDAFNLIDWIMMPTNFWEIQVIHDGIKEHIGQGVAIVNMQKDPNKDYGDGGTFSERLADFYFKLDSFGTNESIIKVGKTKETKLGAGAVTGRTWAFEIMKPFGVRLRNIREVVLCNVCFGKKWKKVGVNSVPCDACNRMGYVDKKVAEPY